MPPKPCLTANHGRHCGIGCEELRPNDHLLLFLEIAAARETLVRGLKVAALVRYRMMATESSLGMVSDVTTASTDDTVGMIL